jgi:hypothetical protein
MRIRSFSSRLLHLVLVPGLVLELAQACGGDDSSPGPATSGSGGLAATGGKSSTGGTGSGTGGKSSTNTGGKSSTGGQLGTGGSEAGGSENTTGGTPSEGGESNTGGTPSTTGGAAGETSVGGGEGGSGGAGPASHYELVSVFDAAGVVAKSAHFKMIATLGEGLGSSSAPGKSSQLSSANYRLASGVTLSTE